MADTVVEGTAEDVVAVAGRVYWLTRSIRRLEGHLAEAQADFDAIDGDESSWTTDTGEILKLHEAVIFGIQAKIELLRRELAGLPGLQLIDNK